MDAFADENLGRRAIARLAPPVDHNYGFGSPGPGVPAGNFSVRWRGYLIPLAAEIHPVRPRRGPGFPSWTPRVRVPSPALRRTPDTRPCYGFAGRAPAKRSGYGSRSPRT